MIRARKYMERITKVTDKKAAKLKKCFKSLFKYQYVRFRDLSKIYKSKGWEFSFANDIFEKKAGCCVSEACAFAFLAKECGYKNVYIAHDTSHSWVMINGLVYDPLFAESKKYTSNYAGGAEDGYRSNPKYKRYI